MFKKGSIGIFDSGYGGLTILKEIEKQLPNHNFIYLGDNARAPYGTRSFESVYNYTLECVEWFFEQDCHLVILACNTASAKALRNIQQKILPNKYPTKRVLGVIRPTTEIIGNFSKTKKLGILATNGTVNSNSYPIEISKFFPGIEVFQQACPMWVPLIENNEHLNQGADYFIQKDLEKLLNQNTHIDTILLGCTHYPLIQEKIKSFLPNTIQVIPQGEIVAKSLDSYLKRHSEIENALEKKSIINFFTTDSTDEFNKKATIFYNKSVNSQFVSLNR
jgi:glutamate racemase